LRKLCVDEGIFCPSWLLFFVQPPFASDALLILFWDQPRWGDGVEEGLGVFPLEVLRLLWEQLRSGDEVGGGLLVFLLGVDQKGR
jgi:hypothetical protein